MPSTLNVDLFASAIKTKRGTKGLRETATEIGDVSSATLSRIEQGNLPDVETFIKICKWLNVSTDTFITGKRNQVIYQKKIKSSINFVLVKSLIQKQ